jgi:hypothetical protein
VARRDRGIYRAQFPRDTALAPGEELEGSVLLPRQQVVPDGAKLEPYADVADKLGNEEKVRGLRATVRERQ